MLNKIGKFQIDKSNWQSCKLGDIASEVSVRVDNPSKSEYERFVGLEHFDSGDLKISRWSSTSNLTSSAKAFKNGDILFARRNAYLRRASIVEFDGCCSGDAFVLREKSKLVLPLFLAMVVNSSDLWDFANSNAAGTMSKRVKWEDLKKFEFLLPPIEAQADLLKLVMAFDDSISKDDSLLKKIQDYKKSLFDHEIFIHSDNLDAYFGNRQSKFKVEKLGNLLRDVQYGISDSLDDSGEIPILRMNNLQNGKLDLTDLKYFTPKMDELDRFILDKGDVLFNRTNSFDLVGKVSLFLESGKYSFASYLIRLKANGEKLDPRYMNFFLNSAIGLSKIRKYRTPGVSQCNINAQNLRNIPIPLPPIKGQFELMNSIENLEEVELNLLKKKYDSKLLLKRFINETI